eukprot:jgi/Mesen1/4548/ME000232S03806
MGDTAASEKKLRIGVLAIQGSFREHVTALRRCGIEGVEVRKPEQLVGLSGLIIPGGESTTMAHVAERNGLIPALRDYGATGKPIWGTCAGLIFLADRAIGQKEGGQALLGGLNCTVHRNFFGSQVNSFEADLPAPAELREAGGADEFRAVFIRAPAVVETGESVQVLAECPVAPQSDSEVQREKVAVAVRQGNLLATAFHPELTDDVRWHSLFLKMVRENKASMDEAGALLDPAALASGESASILRPVNDPGDLPVFQDGSHLKFNL